MRGDIVVGLDIGTTNAKGAVMQLDGEPLALSQRGYEISRLGSEGEVEQDPKVLWAAVCDICREMCETVDTQRIAAVCVGGQGPTLISLDARYRVVSPAMLWMDTRASEESALLSGRAGRYVRPNSPIPQALWLQRHRPDVYERVSCFIGVWDYVVGLLSSEWRWSMPAYDPMAEIGGLDPRKFPEPIVGGVVTGHVTEDASKLTGLPVGLPVVTGWVDRFQEFLGSGLVVKGRACLAGGTSGSVCVLTDADVSEPSPAPTGYSIGNYRGVGGPIQNSGSIITWLRDRALKSDVPIQALIEEAAQVSRGAEGVLFVPYLTPERFLRTDEATKGALLGLSLAHERKHWVRAALEAVAFLFRKAVEQVTESGAYVQEVRVVGGQARSRIWNQIKADVLGMSVHVPRITDSGVVGASVLAAHAVGLADDLCSAAERMVSICQVLEPDPVSSADYQRLYDRFLHIESDLPHCLKWAEGAR